MRQLCDIFAEKPWIPILRRERAEARDRSAQLRLFMSMFSSWLKVGRLPDTPQNQCRAMQFCDLCLSTNVIRHSSSGIRFVIHQVVLLKVFQVSPLSRSSRSKLKMESVKQHQWLWVAPQMFRRNSFVDKEDVVVTCWALGVHGLQKQRVLKQWESKRNRSIKVPLEGLDAFISLGVWRAQPTIGARLGMCLSRAIHSLWPPRIVGGCCWAGTGSSTRNLSTLSSALILQDHARFSTGLLIGSCSESSWSHRYIPQVSLALNQKRSLVYAD